MTENSIEFLEFAIKNKVIQFGEFTTKAGRVSPYFFNTGAFSHGGVLRSLGSFYHSKIFEIEKTLQLKLHCLFGPAYKGISIACTTAISAATHGKELEFAFNRKEKKEHGEKGTIIGNVKNKNVLILDDVISAGISSLEAIRVIKSAQGNPVAVLVAFDRLELSNSQNARNYPSASFEIANVEKIPVFSIANLKDLTTYLARKGSNVDMFKNYVKRWSNFKLPN